MNVASSKNYLPVDASLTTVQPLLEQSRAVTTPNETGARTNSGTNLPQCKELPHSTS
jgi:hypothetical protein